MADQMRAMGTESLLEKSLLFKMIQSKLQNICSCHFVVMDIWVCYSSRCPFLYF